MTQRTAVIMIDMQNMYLQQERRSALGWPPIWNFDTVVAECAALLSFARDARVPVIYTRQTSRADGADATPSMRRLLADHGATTDSPIGAEEEWGSQILNAVAPKPGDIVIEKHRWDAFFNTDLDPILRNLDVTRLVVAGLQTNVCVETTSRTGMMKNFDVAVPEDAVSTDGEVLHRNALDALRVLYVEVAPWRELLAPVAPWERRFTTPGYGRAPEDMALIES
ncbi:cysteine hydrolase family protein [Microbacterium sp. SORGH_AS_0888]|uniref:cysteine hydrolase family protein n=1 Tax=Microbacterium sp. SORGH_AS_0888 TaxID=3041791 RepID=UPI0027885C16|nr:isochorismatase family cysteine hydrolase [Microbacterium sp. SORGH_AS_0888]MDQ1129919.1 ureidoacrylate peracid hydrolase [Microbacterium sp. SORGH_AS_0888]